jgi:hypothetical protein
LSVHKNNVSSNFNVQYFINGNCINVVESTIDLGITVTNSLDFKAHICNIVSKAMQRSSVLFRGFTTRDPALLCKAFITYIRPLLEYNCIVWNPTTVYLINLLESVQRKFTKRIPTLSDLSYSERLEALHLEPLELRRLKFDLINYFKILSLGFNPELASRFVLHHPHSSVRSTVPRLLCPVRSKQQLSSSFFYRQVNTWNSLPDSLKTVKSLCSFKTGLNNIALSSFLIGTYFK